MHRLLVAVGVRGVEPRMSPTLAPRRLLVELGDDRAGADLVEVVVGLRPAIGSPSRLPLMSMVTWSPSAAGRSTVRQLAELLAQPVDLGVDLLVGGLGLGHLDPEAAVAGDRRSAGAPRRRRRRRRARPPGRR